MRSPATLLSGLIQRYLPVPKPDSTDVDAPLSLDRYGGIKVSSASPSDVGDADEGGYFTVSSPTPGTGQLMVAAQTALSLTTPVFYLQNNEPVGGKTIYLRFLKLVSTAAATGCTAIQYLFVRDYLPRAMTSAQYMDWYATSGAPPSQSAVKPLSVQIPNGVSSPPNMLIGFQDSATASVLAAASGQAQTVARGTLGGLNIVGDEMRINFGQYDAGSSFSPTAAEGAGQPGSRTSCDPVVAVPPGFCLAGHIWMPNSSASLAPEFILACKYR